MSSVKSPTRVNDTLLQPLERRALVWLAARMPPWVSPGLLTGTGLLGAAVVFLGYVLTRLSAGFLWLASFGFMLNWFGDCLDGALARYRNIEKPRFGFYIDHVVDAFGEVLIGIGLGLSPYVRFDVALLMLIGYLLLTLQNYIFVCVTGTFIMHRARIGGTEVRLLAIIANSVVLLAGYPIVKLPFGDVSAYDCFGVIFAGALVVAFIASTLAQSIQLAKMDN